MWQKIKPWLLSVALSLSVGGLSALATRGSMDLSGVSMPPLSPPPVVFPIVWGVLFLLMGISAARVWLRREADPAPASAGLAAYASSLVVNFTWSIIFFNFRAFFAAFLWIFLLWFLILRTIFLYRRVDRAAALLQIPYLLWVTFAAYLAGGVWLLNR